MANNGKEQSKNANERRPNIKTIKEIQSRLHAEHIDVFEINVQIWAPLDKR